MFNYNVQQSELDKVLTDLDRLEKLSTMDKSHPKQGLPSYTPLASTMLQRKGSSVFSNDSSTSSSLRTNPHLPPPTKPKPSTNSNRPRRRLSKQQNVKNEYDAILKHPPSIDSSRKRTQSAAQKTAINFTIDEVAEEYMSMYVEVNMEQLKLSLCENMQSPFCQFSIEVFRTEWNRKHNGDHDTYLTINSIQ